MSEKGRYRLNKHSVLKSHRKIHWNAKRILLITINLCHFGKTCYSCRKFTEDNGWLWNTNEVSEHGGLTLASSYIFTQPFIHFPLQWDVGKKQKDREYLWAEMKTRRSLTNYHCRQSRIDSWNIDLMPVKINILLQIWVALNCQHLTTYTKYSKKESLC